jgi:hypothetical protein
VAVGLSTGTKRDIGRHTFEWVTSIAPGRTPSGEVAQLAYDHPGARLNRYGTGPFCRFDFPKDRPFAGVYAITVEDQVTYVGECKNLSVRFGPLGYGHITARNCLANGQSTNCRVNALILEHCLAGRAVDVWFLRTRFRHRIEDELCGLLQPPWNRQLGPRRPGTGRGGKALPTTEDLRRALDEVFAEAAGRGEAAVKVNAGDLHRRAGGHLGSNLRLAACSRVLHAEAGDGDVVVNSPPSGQGASLTMEYRLPRSR